MSLLALQRDFKAGLSSEPPSLTARFRGDQPRGIAVYENAYRKRLGDCLRETFEKTWAWLGDQEFDRAVAGYIAAYPSQSWTLSNYGDRFPEHLARLHPHDPETAELAALEGALRRAFDGAEAAPLAPNEFAADDWGGARLQFVPTLTLLRVTTNCGAIWTSIAAKEVPSRAERLSASAALCVWRKELSPCFRTITGRELVAFELAVLGVRFGEICRLLAQDQANAEDVVEIGGWVGRWLLDEMLASVSSREPALTAPSSGVVSHDDAAAGSTKLAQRNAP